MDDSILLASRLFKAHTVKEVLGVANDLFVGECGASAVAQFLMREDKLIEEHWHGSADSVREGARPSLTTDLEGKRVREMVLDDPEKRWIRISRSAGAHRLYLAALSFEGGSPADPGCIETAERVVEIVAAKLDIEHQLSSARAGQAKFKRWLELSNSQMLILDRERQKFAAVVGQSDMLMLVADENHVTNWANVSLKELMEARGIERVEGRKVDEIWKLLGLDCPPSSSPDSPVSAVFEEGSVVHRESKRKSRDGSSRIMYLTFLPVRSVDGKTAEVLVMIQDLSELETLRRSESHYRHLFERSPNSMIMASKDGSKIVLANLAACMLTGYPPSELEKVTLEDLHEPGDWPRASREYRRTVDRNEVRRFDRQLCGKDGKSITALVTTYRFDLDGESVMVLDLQDVTKQRQLEAELRLSQLPPEPEDDF